jgi:phosphate transport system substrate-binding protein
MISRRSITAGLFAGALCLVAGCKGKATDSGPAGTAAGGAVTLNGAGATFPYPLYSKWMSEYNKLNPNIRINYQSIGSGGGIRQITAGTVDFGASDAPMTADEEKAAPSKLIHIPTTLGAVVVSYNLEGVSTPLKISGDVLADIFLGKISKWNDPKLTGENPDAKLPDKDIAVAYRSDGSGTTAVFTEYLATVSPDFKEKVGAGKSVKWPKGLGAKGNEGVAGQLKTTPGTIGYVELAYAMQNKLPTAWIKNKAGKYIEPKIEAISAAAAGVEMPDTLHVSLADAAGDTAYPISSFTYLLVYEDAKDATKGKTIAEFAWWAIHDGQQYAKALDYAPLPAPVVKKVEAALENLHAGSTKLLTKS